MEKDKKTEEEQKTSISFVFILDWADQFDEDEDEGEEQREEEEEHVTYKKVEANVEKPKQEISAATGEQAVEEGEHSDKKEYYPPRRYRPKGGREVRYRAKRQVAAQERYTSNYSEVKNINPSINYGNVL